MLPFEFRALEVILETVCGHLDVKSIELEREAYPALDDLTVKIISANLERVRRFKSRLVGLSVRVQKVSRSCLPNQVAPFRKLVVDLLNQLYSPKTSYVQTSKLPVLPRN